MNPWTQIAIESLRRKPTHPLRNPVRVLGEVKGLGLSRIVALAHPGTEFLDRITGSTRLTAALVVPSVEEKSGWSLKSARTVGGHKSPSGRVVIGCFNFCGIWLTLGALIDPQVDTLRLRLRNGQEIALDIRDGGYVVVTDDNPKPFQVTVLSQEDEVLEQFHFPPHVSPK